MAELMEAKVFSTFDGQQCVNTFHYLSTGTPAAVTRSFALTAAMGMISGLTPDVGHLRRAWLDVSSTHMTLTESQIKAVYDVTDFYTLPLAPVFVGTIGGVPLPSFNAYALQTNRVRSDIRRGNRRFAGVSETHTNSFGELTVAGQALLDLLAVDMSNILTYDDEGNTLSFNPVVVSKEKYEPSPGKVAYRYYATEIEQAAELAVGVLWTAKSYVTTQVSRKRGRGV